MKALKIQVAVHHRILRDGIEKILKEQSNFNIIGTLKNVDELYACNLEKQGILLLDLEMPNLVAATFIKNHPGIDILIISGSETAVGIKNMMDAGAVGYIFKSRSGDELIKAIDKVRGGNRYLCGSALQQLAGLGDDYNGSQDLTDRESEILILICKEFTNREIGDLLSISVRTVDAHRRNILGKTGAKNTAGIVRYAIKHNIFQLS